MSFAAFLIDLYKVLKNVQNDFSLSASWVVCVLVMAWAPEYTTTSAGSHYTWLLGIPMLSIAGTLLGNILEDDHTVLDRLLSFCNLVVGIAFFLLIYTFQGDAIAVEDTYSYVPGLFVSFTLLEALISLLFCIIRRWKEWKSISDN